MSPLKNNIPEPHLHEPLSKAVIKSVVLELLKRLPKRPCGLHCGAPSPADHVIRKMQTKIDSVSTAFIICGNKKKYKSEKGSIAWRIISKS